MDEDKVLKALSEQKTALDDNFGEIKTSVDDLTTRMKEVEDFQYSRKADLPGVDEEKEEFSFLRAVNAMRSNDWRNAQFEQKVFDEARKKATMGQSTDTTGGYLVPEQYIGDLIEALRAESVVMKAGATILNDLKGSPVEIPYQNATSTAYWINENAAITASDPTVGNVSLTPNQCAALVKMSNRLLRMSIPSAEAMVRADLAKSLALAIDLAALEGQDTYGPAGLFGMSGVGTAGVIGTDGGTFTYDHAIKMEGDLDDANALRGSLAFIMHPKISRKLKSLKIANYSGQTTSNPYYYMPMSDENLNNALGYPFHKSTQLSIVRGKGTLSSASFVFFGNWKEMLIGQWGGLELMASEHAGDGTAPSAFTGNQTWIRAIQEVDVAVRHTASFSLCADADVTP